MQAPTPDPGVADAASGAPRDGWENPPFGVGAPGFVLLDAGALGDLASQIGEAPARRFVVDFLAAWPARASRIRSVVERRERGEGIEAVLSLRSSAGMIGAVRLAELASWLHRQVRASQWENAARGLPGVLECGDATVAELRRYL